MSGGGAAQGGPLGILFRTLSPALPSRLVRSRCVMVIPQPAVGAGSERNWAQSALTDNTTGGTVDPDEPFYGG
jgi:hypothetical protein